jgi:hypothetical protein
LARAQRGDQVVVAAYGREALTFYIFLLLNVQDYVYRVQRDTAKQEISRQIQAHCVLIVYSRVPLIGHGTIDNSIIKKVHIIRRIGAPAIGSRIGSSRPLARRKLSVCRAVLGPGYSDVDFDLF